MGDSSMAPNSNVVSETRVCRKKKQSMTHLAATASEVVSQKTIKCFSSAKQRVKGSGVAGDLVVFFAITAALNVVRRISRAKCPFVWHALQALQALHFPPLKWLQRWHPIKGLAKSTEKFSRPMLALSIATLFCEESGYSNETSNDENQSQDLSRSGPVPSSQGVSLDNRVSSAEDWLVRLNEELQRQGIILPERLGEDELHRFYAAVHGDFQRLIAAVKKTVEWRLSYQLLQPQELQSWSHLLFWHGRDMSQRPCLIIHLGLACSTLPSIDMPLFVQAVVSQIEDGVLNLVQAEQPQIMVLMDCLGLSPLGFPIHVMRSCATLLQDHYPNRLGSLMIIRLPPLARVVTQTLFQVLRPSTRRKVRTLGRNYLGILSECLDSLPSSLGGNCACSICSGVSIVQQEDGDTILVQPEAFDHLEDHIQNLHQNHASTHEDGYDFKRTFAMVLMILCMLSIIGVGIHLQESLQMIVLQKLL